MPAQPKVSKDLNELFLRLHPFVKEHGHEFVTPEHLLYLLIGNHRVRQLLDNLGAESEAVKDDLEHFFRDKLEKVAGIERPFDTLATSRIVNNAVARSFSSEKPVIDVVDFMVAVMEEERSHAHYFLRRHGVGRFALIKEISHGDYLPAEFAAEPAAEPAAESAGGDGGVATEPREKSGAEPRRPGKPAKFLPRYAINLVETARQGKIDPIIGRKTEMERMIRTLHRKKKNNPLLVGESGVGKTAIIEGLARKIALDDELPEQIRGVEIWALEMGSLIAGTKYRGEFEDRLKKVIDEVRGVDNIILFIDEIHTVVGAGAVSGGSLDASNILKPALNAGEIRCVGATTYDDYKNHILKDKAFSRRFQKIDVREPSENETVAILAGLRPYYENHYQVSFSLKALDTATKLANRHISDRFLPDKAIDVIDEAGARNSVAGAKRKKQITVRDIEAVVAEMANVPPAKVSATDLGAMRGLEDNLKAAIYGQDEAVHKVAKAVKINRAGIGNPDRPAGSFLFAGPTGVGKTELARQLAALLGIKFIRFDMSEYAEKHTISKLIGAPPGYVGFEQSGMLTEALIKTPHALVLFDEIEKAHPDIFNVLLQVMDYGTLTDNNGRKADFRNAVIIMTSNVGARELDANAIGFGREAGAKGDTAKAVEKFFTPEFRNRLDAMVHFNRLDAAMVVRVAEKFLRSAATDLRKRGIELQYTPAVRDWFAEHGHDPKMGARPMERLVRAEILEKLVDEILFGSLALGGEVAMSVLKGELKLAAKSKSRPNEPRK